MNVKINIYTSCYSKMLSRHKNFNDLYIRVSRSLFYPKKGVDNKSIMSLIDVNCGEFLGMYENTLEEYENRIRTEDYKEVLKDFTEVFSARNLLEDMTDADQKEVEKEKKKLEAKIKKLTQEEFLKQYKELSEEEKETWYSFGLTEKTDIKNWKPCLTFNFFILCFEDLESKYTEKDEKKNPDCKAGTFKTCHRTVLAKVLNERFNLGITEW